MSYKNLVKNETPVTEKTSENQVQSSDGAWVFQADQWTLFERFLVLGTDKPTYYTSASVLTMRAIRNFDKLLMADGIKYVDTAVSFSVENRIPKNETALLALAYAISNGDRNTRAYVADVALHQVARTASDLFLFVEYAREFRGWGEVLKRAVRKWYEVRSLDERAYQMLKYQARKRDTTVGSKKPGYGHKSLLKLAHVKPADEEESNLYRYVRGFDDFDTAMLPEIMAQYEYLKTIDNPRDMANAIAKYNGSRKWGLLTHEMVPNFKGSPEVWDALIPTMPMGALITNLGRITSYGLLPAHKQDIIKRLTNQEMLHRARIHPVRIIGASLNYSDPGRGLGNLTWRPDVQVADALEDAYELAFNADEALNQRILIGLDVSGSMHGYKVAYGMTASEASIAMSLFYMRTEQDVILTAFSSTKRYSYGRYHQDELDGIMYMNSGDIAVSKRTSIQDAMRKLYYLPFASTNLSLPMRLADRDNLEVDLFMIFTDNELNTGSMHPHQALRKYRKSSGINAGLVVNAMAANEITIADPNDPRQLDVAGFDASVPRVIGDYFG